MDIQKQIAYWRDGSHKALRSVRTLEEGEFWGEALFWTHLATEKALKAHVVKKTQDIPPYIHRLVRLAEITELELSPQQLQLCEAMSEHQRLARYPDEVIPEPGAEIARLLLNQAKEFHQWLLEKL